MAGRGRRSAVAVHSVAGGAREDAWHVRVNLGHEVGIRRCVTAPVSGGVWPRPALAAERAAGTRVQTKRWRTRWRRIEPVVAGGSTATQGAVRWTREAGQAVPGGPARPLSVVAGFGPAHPLHVMAGRGHCSSRSVLQLRVGPAGHGRCVKLSGSRLVAAATAHVFMSRTYHNTVIGVNF
jgi:hypothetical protein